jgi:ferredoxin
MNRSQKPSMVKKTPKQTKSAPKTKKTKKTKKTTEISTRSISTRQTPLPKSNIINESSKFQLATIQTANFTTNTQSTTLKKSQQSKKASFFATTTQISQLNTTQTMSITTVHPIHTTFPRNRLGMGLSAENIQISAKKSPKLTKNKPIETLTQIKNYFSTNDVIDVTYIEPSGESVPLRIKKSENKDESLMTLAVKNQVDMEGSCDGQLACSTCHCILSQEDYDAFMKLKPPTDEELDMLDTAFGLTQTSRLGCQIPVSMLEKNITLTLPKFTR